MSYAFMDKSLILGFGTINDTSMTDERQCECFSISTLYKVVKALKDLGIESVYVTVEKDKPLFIGGKSLGIAVAQYIEGKKDEDKRKRIIEDEIKG